VSALALALALAASCDPSALSAGEHKLTAGGLERAYLVREPVKKSAKPAPLVFVWHGWGGRAENQLRAFEARFPEAYVVAARGMPRQFPKLGEKFHDGWQLKVGEFADRDLKLYDALLARAKASGCVDDKRVTSTGFSNGGFFTNLLGCVRGETLAGIAPAGGGGPFEGKCGPAVPTLVVHGRKDRVVAFTRAEGSFAHYRRRAACSAEARFLAGCQSVAGCETELRSCAFPGGHRFPQDMRDEVESFLEAQKR
jgi:polyhydroxybutyrate depolymerase